jgi:hypothetical protein
MTKRTSSCGFLVLASVLVATSPAWADPSPADKAASDVLFKDAKRLVEEGRINEACPKFEESQRLDPTPGTLLNLGDCYKGASPPRNASAWGAYRQAEVMARQRGDAARQEGAALRAQAVEPLLSKVTIAVPPAARIPGLEVTWDGRPVGEGLFESAFPVDAGEHTIVARAPGHKSWTGKVLVQPGGGVLPVVLPALVPGPVDVASGPAAEAAPFWSTQRSLGLGIGFAGVAGVLVGSIFGAKAAGANTDSLPHCQPNDVTLCDAQGVALRNDAFSAATVSTVSFIVGGAALVGGTIVFLTAPSSKPTSAAGAPRIELQPRVAVGSGGFTLRGTW